MILRVFPRRTSFTPTDEYAVVGAPRMMLPADVTEVRVSCAFTWDKARSAELADAWGQYYPVSLGGPAFDSPSNGFVPGMYVKRGATFTSRGCNNQCPWCLVPEREGRLIQLEIVGGNIVQDNNFLQCNQTHRDLVFAMLRTQRAVSFSGGLDARLFTDQIASEIHSLSIDQVFFAVDTKESIRWLRKATAKLALPRDKIRCFVLLKYNPNETISEATDRLHSVWEARALPFAQLYQPPDRWIEYSHEWKALARIWSRPAAMKSLMKRSS